MVPQALSTPAINSADVLATRPIKNVKLAKKITQYNSATNSIVKFAKLTPQPNSATTSPRNAGHLNRASKTQKLNLEVSPHRAVSAVRLMRIDLGGAFADLLKEQGKGSGDNEMGYVERTLGFRTRDLDDRDLRLVTDIVGGTIRWRRYLDYLILSLCHDEDTFSGMEPLLLQILRIGFYEIVKLEMPPYAVVDENVRLAKVALRPGAGNMVNGILRKLVLLKENNSIPSPKVDGDNRQQARALATIYSHPVWMVRRWIKLLGRGEATRLMMWNNKDPSFSLRANIAKGFRRSGLIIQLEKLKVPHELSAHLDHFVRIKTGMQGYLKMACVLFKMRVPVWLSPLSPQPCESILDCCAAPGGKTLFLASCLNGQGMVTAVDINKGRLRILKETAKLHQVHNVVTTVHSDLRIFAKNNHVKYDKVLLDAPCSGLGVLSMVSNELADLRWNRRLEDMDQLKKLQDELLDAASMGFMARPFLTFEVFRRRPLQLAFEQTLVKPGGVLIYSTCSIDPEENEERIASFLLRHPEFVTDPAERFVAHEFVTEHGYYLTNPVMHSMDGAFAPRLIRS